MKIFSIALIAFSFYRMIPAIVIFDDLPLALSLMRAFDGI
jgi:hypothetical protein